MRTFKNLTVSAILVLSAIAAFAQASRVPVAPSMPSSSTSAGSGPQEEQVQPGMGGAKLNVTEAGKVSISGPPGLTVTPAASPNMSAIPKTTVTQSVRPDLKNYADGMTWASEVVLALMLGFALFVGIRTLFRKPRSTGYPEPSPLSPLKQERAKKKAEKISRENAAKSSK